MEKQTFTFSIELFTFHLFSSATLKTRKGHLKKCTSFEEQKDTRYIWGNIYFDIIVFSSLSFTTPCLGFLLICFDRDLKGCHKIS